jgi:hypothetical protein
LCLALSPQAAWALGFVVNVSDMKEWIKVHPNVNPKIVKVTTVKEWLKQHPNVNPANRPQFKPDEVISYPAPLTPTISWPKAPADMRNASLLVVGLDPKEGVVFEANEITAGTITIPAGKLKPGKTYFYQLAYILKNGEIVDGGSVQFETEKK